MNQPAPPPKKGLGTGAKVGIGCGVIVLLAIIGFVVMGVIVGGKVKKFAEDAQKNPTRATAELLVVAGGQMVAEDDVAKRYTIKTPDGKLTTIYWNESKQTAETISGDFSAIPSSEPLPAAPEPPPSDPDKE